MDYENIKKIAINTGIGIVISVLFLLLNGFGAFEFMYDWGNYLSKPITFGVGQFTKGVSNFFSTVTEIGSLKEENTILEGENDILFAQIERSREFELQNEILLAQLDSSSTSGMTLKLARILGIDQSGPAEHVIIDIGFEDSVTIGDPVVLGDILIGDVRDVYKSTSRVRLVTNRNSNIVVLDRNTRAKGLVRGSLSGLLMEDVLESEDINVDDVIVTWSDSFPKNLIVGTVVEVEDNPTASTKKAYLDPGVSLENLNYVFVVKDE